MVPCGGCVVDEASCTTKSQTTGDLPVFFLGILHREQACEAGAVAGLRPEPFGFARPSTSIDLTPVEGKMALRRRISPTLGRLSRGVTSRLLRLLRVDQMEWRLLAQAACPVDDLLLDAEGRDRAYRHELVTVRAAGGVLNVEGRLGLPDPALGDPLTVLASGRSLGQVAAVVKPVVHTGHGRTFPGQGLITGGNPS